MSQFENRTREASGEHKENPFSRSAQRARQRDHADATRSGSYGSASSAYSTGGSVATAGQAAAVMNHYADDASERGYPKVIEIGSEKISVNSSQDERLAGEIIAEIKDQYGIEISSPSGIEAIKKEYGQVPQEVTSKLQTKHWEIKELIALRSALARFTPLLGKNRAKSSRKDAVQEVLSVSKLDQGIDHNRPDGNLDHSTAGEYFGKSKNFGLFSAGTNVVSDFSSDKKHNDKDLEGLIIHEVAHGLLDYKINEFVQISGYWKNQFQPGEILEPPITDYAKTSASEDLSESVKYYFLAPKKLESQCPRRYKFIKEVVDSWQSEQAGAGTKPSAGQS